MDKTRKLRQLALHKQPPTSPDANLSEANVARRWLPSFSVHLALRLPHKLRNWSGFQNNFESGGGSGQTAAFRHRCWWNTYESGTLCSAYNSLEETFQSVANAVVRVLALCFFFSFFLRALEEAIKIHRNNLYYTAWPKFWVKVWGVCHVVVVILELSL